MTDWFSLHILTFPMEFRKNIRTEMKGCWFQPDIISLQIALVNDNAMRRDCASVWCILRTVSILQICRVEILCNRMTLHFFLFPTWSKLFTAQRFTDLYYCSQWPRGRLPGSYHPTILPSSFLYCNGVSEEYINYSAQIQLKFRD